MEHKEFGRNKKDFILADLDCSPFTLHIDEEQNSLHINEPHTWFLQKSSFMINSEHRWATD